MIACKLCTEVCVSDKARVYVGGHSIIRIDSETDSCAEDETHIFGGRAIIRTQRPDVGGHKYDHARGRGR